MAATHSAGAQGAPASRLRSFRERYGRVLEWVVGALMVVLAVEVTLGVVFRTFGQALAWYDELASVLLARRRMETMETIEQS